MGQTPTTEATEDAQETVTENSANAYSPLRFQLFGLMAGLTGLAVSGVGTIVTGNAATTNTGAAMFAGGAVVLLLANQFAGK
jgi:hypothetical protein